MTALIRRELGIVLGAPATWAVLALAALLIGHGFVLALDLFAAASRSAMGQRLMRRELDPLLGIVRPTFGGVQLAAALLLPILAARPLAMEKERNSFAALALTVGSTDRVIAAKLIAAWLSAALLLAIPVALLTGFVLAGGHLASGETLVTFLGYGLFVALIASASVAGAAATRSFAQAATLGMLLSLGSWAIDASEGFSALAWLGSFASLSVGAQLAGFEHGVLAFGGLAWLMSTIVTVVGRARVGARSPCADGAGRCGAGKSAAGRRQHGKQAHVAPSSRRSRSARSCRAASHRGVARARRCAKVAARA
jgi:ABC-type transport system involved in multi-copper enzyme maturation permease subunit